MAESSDTRPTGHLHPITIMIDTIARTMTGLGFDIEDGPELETEYFNFDALNVPKDHPSRDMQDTFWLKQNPGEERKLMRTQTSPVQVRYMKKMVSEGKYPDPYYAIVVPGKVFRNEATDATHETQFFQVEGLMVGKDVTLGTMKGVLDPVIRLRSSFFPFVEPGVEVDMQCFKCRGAGCNVCKQVGWIEIMGAGMVHPNVLLECGLDPRVYKGFAFGGGVDRMAMLKWGIDDVRLLYNGDLRVVTQF
jgi:phenylalanyl-tRNA synthetase alpha chain